MVPDDQGWDSDDSAMGRSREKYSHKAMASSLPFNGPAACREVNRVVSKGSSRRFRGTKIFKTVLCL